MKYKLLQMKNGYTEFSAGFTAGKFQDLSKGNGLPTLAVPEPEKYLPDKALNSAEAVVLDWKGSETVADLNNPKYYLWVVFPQRVAKKAVIVGIPHEIQAEFVKQDKFSGFLDDFAEEINHLDAQLNQLGVLLNSMNTEGTK